MHGGTSGPHTNGHDLDPVWETPLEMTGSVSARQRLAVLNDAARIQALMRASARELFPRFYAARQTASAEGFQSLVLMATLPGEPLYRAFGFERSGARWWPCTTAWRPRPSRCDAPSTTPSAALVALALTPSLRHKDRHGRAA
jgi:hypothetical protein